MLALNSEIRFPYFFLRKSAADAQCELEGSEQQASSKKGDGDAKTDGEGDVNKEGGAGKSGSFNGRSRWSQVVARIRQAGGGRLAGGDGLSPQNRFLILPTPTAQSPQSFIWPSFTFLGDVNVI